MTTPRDVLPERRLAKGFAILEVGPGASECPLDGAARPWPPRERESRAHRAGPIAKPAWQAWTGAMPPPPAGNLAAGPRSYPGSSLIFVMSCLHSYSDDRTRSVSSAGEKIAPHAQRPKRPVRRSPGTSRGSTSTGLEGMNSYALPVTGPNALTGGFCKLCSFTPRLVSTGLGGTRRD